MRSLFQARSIVRSVVSSVIYLDDSFHIFEYLGLHQDDYDDKYPPLIKGEMGHNVQKLPLSKQH